MSGKFFELLDFPKFAYPSIVGMDPAQTSGNLIDRLNGKAFMSYGPIWSRMRLIANGLASDDYVSSELSFHKDGWKNNALQGVAKLLRDHFGGRGSWYPVPTKPQRVLGFWFKPSIKVIWFVDGQAYAVLINARKGQPLFDEHIRFLARGVYELHCREDPNDPIPLILDVSEIEKGAGRTLRAHAIVPERAISLEEFEESVDLFLKSLQLAGVLLPSIEWENVIDLFKKK